MALYRTDGCRPLGKGQHCPAGSLTDTELLGLIRGYKRKVASRYRAVVADEFATVLPHTPLLVSRKIDGETWFLVLDPESKQVFLASPKGRVVQGDVPLLQEAQAAVARVKGRTVLAGEFFAVNKGGVRPRVGDLSAAMAGEQKADVKRLAFAAFDLVMGGDEETPTPLVPYEQRLEVLRRVLQDGKRTRAVQTEALQGADKVSELFDAWVSSGQGEGLVIRAGEDAVFKAKPTINLDGVIIGYTESSEGKHKVGSLLLALMRENGQFQLIGSCGNMPTEVREQFMGDLSADHVASDYRHANSRGALYHFVQPRTVIEIKLTDIQAEDSTGNPIERMVLEYGDDGWRRVRPMAGASILHPVFVRIRDDKEVNPTDVRVGQVLERCLVQNLDRQAEKIVLPPSEIVRREVYVKTMKGQQAVRKLVVWQSNKQELDSSYPAFVVHYTDYSAGRKQPLQREVRLAPDQDTAQQVAEDILKAKIKKGWDRVDDPSAAG